MLCSEASLVNTDGSAGHAVTLRCKRWSCPICQPFNRKAVIRKARRGSPNAFITLTCKPDIFECPDDAARAMKEGWVALRKRIVRRYGKKKIPFIAVFERTKKGWPHLHILVRAPWIDQKWLSNAWEEITGAYIVDIRKIDDEGRAARYVSKYVGKDPHVFEGCKRYWRSHDYDIAEDDKSPLIMYGQRWQEEGKTLEQLKRDLVAMGYYITEEREGYIHYERWYKHLLPEKKRVDVRYAH